MATSPTQRSLKLLRDEGFLVSVVEHWNPHARIRQDMFGCIDLVALGNGQTIGVQTTSYSNMSARRNKIAENPALEEMSKSGWIVEVHGWKKGTNGRWSVKRVRITVEVNEDAV